MQKSQYKAMFEVEDTHWWFLAKRKFIEVILDHSKSKLFILDIGCGTGGTSKFLQKYGSVTRIEESPFAFPYLKRRKISHLPYSVNNYRIPKNFFDLVFLLDVLYHKNIIDDQKVLKKAYAGLKDGGIIYITDCAIPFLFSPHDKNMQARQRYTQSELESKVKKAGFVILRSSYAYFFLFPVFILQRILSNFLPISGVSRPPIILNKLLLFICTLEAILIRFINYPIGSSIIIVAKKND